MKSVNYKVICFVLLAFVVLEALWIFFLKDLTNSIKMLPYSFSDSVDGLVTAEGSWISPIRFANPLSTTTIKCYRDSKICLIADATILDAGFKDKYLSSGLKLVIILEWTDGYIQTEPSIPITKCIEESYRLDRKNKVVTYTSTKIDNSERCSDYQDTPKVSRLGDGEERLKIYKKISK